MNNAVPMLLSGLGTNLLICIAAWVHPMLVGMTVLLVKRGRKVGRICPAWYIAECVPPIALLLALWYGVFTTATSILITILALSIAHTAYIPIHIRESYSVRNYFAAAIDLFSSLLKWSMAASLIAVVDIQRAAMIYAGRTYTYGIYFAVCAAVFLILLLLQGVKQIILRTGMKKDKDLPSVLV